MGKEKNAVGFGIGLIAGVVGGLIAGVLYAPKPGKESREKLKATVEELAEKHSPAIQDAKKKAYESIDLLRYKLERHYKKFDNMLKSRKMRKAKELEETEYDVN
ncbi:YtxH domain-containing protein [bacterium]|nr:YtxH domain-containing protein [bacterium]